jgi:anti-anti-sigma factor
MAPLLQSATTPTDGSAIVTVRGDIDADTAAQLWQYLGYLIGQGHHHIVLDLRGMILIDSVGVEVITRASAWTRRKGGELVLRSASPALVEQLELARRAETHRRHPAAAGDQPEGLATTTGRTTCRRLAAAPELLQQLTLAVLDHAAEDGRTIKMLRA